MGQDSVHLQKNKQPIFIHSLFRAGSTYLFHVFRRSDADYYCYQEPLHEISLYAKNNYGLLLNENDEKAILLRHPTLGKSYFFELYKVAEKCLPSLDQVSIYDSYFNADDDNHGIEFWSNLINESLGRPVIQECRTSSRLGNIKSSLGGFHIYLWRNPWDQWWSHKVTEYFDAANQMFINTPKYPEIIARLRQEIGFIPCEIDNIDDRIKWFMEHKLAQKDSYLIFYILWLLGIREAQGHADIMVNIDRLSDSTEYRRQFTDDLMNSGVIGIDFSDCSIPQAIYTKEERIFFENIENKAHGLLLLSGISKNEIDHFLAIRQQYQPKIWRISKINNLSAGLIRDAERARSLVHKAEATQMTLRTNFASLKNDWNAANFRIQELTNELSLFKQEHLLLNEKLAKTILSLDARESALADQQSRSQWLQNEWDIAKTRLEELSGKLAEKSAILSIRENALAQQQTHSQWIQNEWDAAKTRLEELSRKLAEKSTILSAREEALTQQQVCSQWLQNEWDTAKTGLEELSVKLAEKNEALLKEQAHSQWLQNEWNSAKAQIDGYNHELDYIYNSKSWKITLPFRLLLKGKRWFLKSSIAFLTFAPENKSKQVLESLIIQLKRKVKDQTRTKIVILRVLTPFPRLKARLISMGHSQVSIKEPDITLFRSETDAPKDLSPRARKIYTNLIRAVEGKKGESH